MNPSTKFFQFRVFAWLRTVSRTKHHDAALHGWAHHAKTTFDAHLTLVVRQRDKATCAFWLGLCNDTFGTRNAIGDKHQM